MYSQRSVSEDVATLKQSFDRLVWKAMTTFGFDNSRGTMIYNYQVEYTYLINSIERDSSFVAKKQVHKVRELVDEFRAAIAAKEKEKEIKQ